MKFEAKKQRKLSLARLGMMTEPQIHKSTVRRELDALGIHRRRAYRKPYISKVNRQKRMKWAREHKHWTMFYRRHVIWSDECYVYIGDNKGAIYVTRSENEAYDAECLIPTFTQSNIKCMIWACIAESIRGPIRILDFPGGKGGGMNADRYAEQVLNGPLLDFYKEVKA